MDPISAISLTAGAVQFADVSLSSMIRLNKLLESLKHTLARAGELLEDLNRSTLRLYAIQSFMQ